MWTGSYVDGKNTYSVVIVATTGQNVSNDVMVNYTQSASYTYHSPDTTETLTWRKPRYSSAVKNITITENGSVVGTIAADGDSTYSFHLPSAAFGLSYSIGLTVNPAYPYSSYIPYTFSASLSNLTNSPHIKAVTNYINKQGYYYSQSLNKLVSFNESDGYARFYNSSLKVSDSTYVGSMFFLSLSGSVLVLSNIFADWNYRARHGQRYNAHVEYNRNNQCDRRCHQWLGNLQQN